VHLVGAATAAIMNIGTYEATVDRQVLGNDARHLVHRPELGHASMYGSAGAAIDLAVPVGCALAAKRTAMAKHASQIPVGALAL
jgi:hypothetical protein